jgi:hypothetical protein
MPHAETEAIFRFNVPDHDISADQRALFALAAPKAVNEVRLPLHDIRTAVDLPEPAQCLERRGFAMVVHQPPSGAFDSTESVETLYMPSICELVKSVTGCKSVLVNNLAFRRKPVNAQADPMFYHKAGGDFDKIGRSMPTDRPFGESTRDHTPELQRQQSLTHYQLQ